MWISKEIRISVEGDGYLQGYGNANPQAIAGYQDEMWNTYDGQVMAVIRSGLTKGIIRVTFWAEGCKKQVVEIRTI